MVDENNIGDPLSKKLKISENVTGPCPKRTTKHAMTTAAGGNIKTQLCIEFRSMGHCDYGSKCQFAHGTADLRKSSWPNLQRTDVNVRTCRRMDQQNLCKMFYSGKECRHGDKCRFLHLNPETSNKYYRESSAISIGSSSSSSYSSSSGLYQSGFKRRKLCNNWLITGGSSCPYGDMCIFAHGQAELEKPAGHFSGFVPTEASKTLPMVKDGVVTSHGQQVRAIQCILKWKALKNVSGIYADWIEDMHLPHNDAIH